jgi:histidine triad (HIT) family protein
VTFVHQDDRCVVIRDINPQAPTHVLVIPREHLESLDDVGQKDEGLWATCFMSARESRMTSATLSQVTEQ